MRQIKFDFMNDFKTEFGGSLLRGKRKAARPLATKRPLHVIFKTSGRRYFTPGNRAMENLIHRYAAKFEIKIYRLSLNWTHFHAILQIPSRVAYNSFVRSVAAAIVRKLSKLLNEDLKSIFDLRPFTRILEWGRDFQNVMAYHDLNDLEARGFIRRDRQKNSGRSNSKARSRA